jgi:hypothetical protein
VGRINPVPLSAEDRSSSPQLSPIEEESVNPDTLQRGGGMHNEPHFETDSSELPTSSVQPDQDAEPQQKVRSDFPRRYSSQVGVAPVNHAHPQEVTSESPPRYTSEFGRTASGSHDPGPSIAIPPAQLSSSPANVPVHQSDPSRAATVRARTDRHGEIRPRTRVEIVTDALIDRHNVPPMLARSLGVLSSIVPTRAGL